MKVNLHKWAAIAAKTLNKFAQVKEGREFFSWGAKNDFPLECLDQISKSGTAQIALNRKKKFIIADGFSEESLNELKLNKKQTAKDLLEEAALDLSYLNGVAFRVIFSNSGKAAEIHHLPLKHLRRGTEEGVFFMNKLFGEVSFKKGDTKKLLEFTGSENTSEIKADISRQLEDYDGEQFGRVVFIFSKGFHRYGDKYPLPAYYSGLEDIEADASLSRLELSNLKKAWRANVIIGTGPIDNETKDEDDKTALDYFDRSLKGFVGEDGSTVLHLMGQTAEDRPDVWTIDPSTIIDGTEKASERIPRKVCRLLEVPPVLCGFSSPGKLGDNQQILNEIELFALTVFDLQDLFKRALTIVFPEKDFEITTLKIWNQLPADVIKRLTLPELRKIYELEPVSDPDPIETKPLETPENVN